MGSSPTGNIFALMPEWSKGADLRSAIFGCVGSNPTQCTYVSMAQWIARATSNREVAGSSPARDFFYWFKMIAEIMVLLVYNNR